MQKDVETNITECGGLAWMVSNWLKYIVSVTFTHPNKSCGNNVFQTLLKVLSIRIVYQKKVAEQINQNAIVTKKGNNKNEFNITNN